MELQECAAEPQDAGTHSQSCAVEVEDCAAEL